MWGPSGPLQVHMNYMWDPLDFLYISPEWVGLSFTFNHLLEGYTSPGFNKFPDFLLHHITKIRCQPSTSSTIILVRYFITLFVFCFY